MALGQTFDLARIYSAGENIKGQRLENQRNQIGLDYDKVVKDTAQSAHGPDGKYDPVAHSKALAAAGYPQAGQEILQKVIDHTAKFDNYIQGRLPMLSAATYPAFKKQVEASGMVGAGILPDQYDEATIQGLLAKYEQDKQAIYGAMEDLTPQGAPDGVRIYGQRNTKTGEIKGEQVIRPTPRGMKTVIDENGVPRYEYPEEGDRAPTPGGSRGAGFKFTASDSNAIYRQAAGLFGGVYDPLSGRIGGLDPQQAAQVQSIAAAATAAYKDAAGGMDHATAVEQAFQRAKGGGAPAPAPQQGGQPVRITGAEDYARLPSGTTYIDPKGVTRVKR